MLLSYDELLALVARGVIQNVATHYINAASVDITLGAKILEEKVPDFGPVKPISLRDREPLPVVEQDCTDGYVLNPGEFILAQSEQWFNLPDDISAEYKLKSSMARIGLNHALAGWCDAGWHGSVLTLELTNTNQHHPITLRKGDRIGQMVFFNHRKVSSEVSYRYRGRYNNDKHTQGAKS